MDKKLENYRSKKRRENIFNKLKQRFLNMVSMTRTDNSKKEEHIIIPDVSKLNLEPNRNSFAEFILVFRIEKVPAVPIDASSDSSDEESSGDIDCSTSDENDGVEKIAATPAEPRSRLTYFTYILYFCFWATCWMIAIELKFGTVFLLFSALFGIYFNTRTEPKRKNEVSAYSVFNENCASIDGTLTAEQFEREIRYGPTSVH